MYLCFIFVINILIVFHNYQIQTLKKLFKFYTIIFHDSKQKKVLMSIFSKPSNIYFCKHHSKCCVFELGLLQTTKTAGSVSCTFTLKPLVLSTSITANSIGRFLQHLAIIVNTSQLPPNCISRCILFPFPSCLCP